MVATFRLSKVAKVGATIDRQRRVGGPGPALRAPDDGQVPDAAPGLAPPRPGKGMSASRFRYRVVLTARDRSGSKSGAGVRYWVRSGGNARGLRAEVGPLVATRCKPVPWISRLRVTQAGSRWVATSRLARKAKVGGFMGRQLRAGPVHRLQFRTVKRFGARTCGPGRGASCWAGTCRS